MSTLHTTKQRNYSLPLLIFTILFYLVVLFINNHSVRATDWTLVSAFLKSYCLILSMYAVFRFYDIYLKQEDSINVAFQDVTKNILSVVRKLFLALISLRAIICLWHSYQLTMTSNDVGANIIHFLLKELWILIEGGGEWLRHHILIIVTIKNPCIQISAETQYCLEDYPLASYILVFGLFFTIKKALKFPYIQPITKSILKMSIKLIVWLLQKMGRLIVSPALRIISEQVLVQVFSQIWTEIKSMDNWVDTVSNSISSKVKKQLKNEYV